MATLDTDGLLRLLELRYDHFSARAVMGDVLSRLGLEGRTTFEKADLQKVADVLAQPPRRAESIVEELRRLAGGAPVPAAPAAQRAPEPPAARPPEKAAEKPPEKPAEKPAAKPAPVDFVVGAAPEAECPAGVPLRILAEKAGFVRWGTQGWKKPPPELQPAGSTPVADSEAIESRMQPLPGPHPFHLILGPFATTAGEINFTVRYEDGSWAKDAKVKIVAK